MKKPVILILTTLVIAAGLFAACTVCRPVTAISDTVIRLHILANSDSEEDQNVKLKVRDLVLGKWGDLLSARSDGDGAWEALQALLPEINRGVGAYLEELGADYGVKASAGVYEFPERAYEGVAFPEGAYRALRISLGDAAGQNWWCVLFPPLCLIGEDGEMDVEQYKDLVRALDEEGVPPKAPVRSWLFDALLGEEKWDEQFLDWAREHWLGGRDE